ncbi:BTAD domain-containing putative transcriptional regulator [Actinocorallia sp. A-T 12471]|uniref:BTAD domain-containing putative transcriptional regulator n=1 Tax=Actinocorallia sp. A-T 12471 TaxID=3089813 RepID=UPI0029CD0C93|nr:BTAD domain-containing putative transcriptional regulator [Actinocorallia sp. A-T 12471]MDX6743509.1 BTAD domain-containing putative transcriptional regulator [Actinocorallia sp. A-T 12471]
MVEIRALGALEARVGGNVADLGGTRQRAVLARLVAAHGRMVPVDRLIEDLWPGEAPPRALAGVQAFVSHLRRALEPGRPPRTPAGVLVTRAPGYALVLDEAAVDVWRFEALASRTADPAEALASAEEALALWRGPAYAEFTDLPWAEAEAARLDGLRLTAVERRAAALLDAGEGARALTDLEAHTAENPLREELWRLLALGLYRAGRQADALAALRKVRDLLADELGVDPGPALRKLEHDILRQDTALAAAAPAPAVRAVAPPPPEPVPLPQEEPLVGREDEVGEVLAAVRAGRRVVLVSGEAGAGKTAFADRICRDLAREGWRHARGRTPEVDGAPAAWAWAELLRALHAVRPAPDALAPMLDDDTPAPSADPSVARFRLHRAIGGYLADLAHAAPLAVVLEDLHRADTETLGLLAGLPERAPDVLFIGTFRSTEPSEPLADALAALAGREPVRIALGGLRADAVADLVRRVCRREVDAATLAAVAERTAGNPFFVRETARLLDAEGPDAALREVPSGVGDVLRRRVARLPATAATVLRTGAVLGREVDLDVLTRVCELGEDTVLEALEAALITGLITEDETGARFAHVLVRDTLYGELSRLRRARLHGRVANALEELRPGDSAALAHHHLAAGTRLDRAVVHASRAAEAAEARFAHRAAVELWASALEAHTRTGGAVAGRMELTARLVRALVLAGDVMTARVRRDEAVAALEDLAKAGPTEVELAARVLTAFDTPMLWANRPYGLRDDRLVATMEAVLERLPRGETRVRLLTSIALELDGDASGRGVEAAEEAVALARDLGGGKILVHALNGLFNNSYRGAGDVVVREAIGREMVELAERHSLGEYVALGHLSLHQNACCRLDFEASRALHERGVELARRYELPLLVNLASWRPCLDHTLAGRFDEAGAHAEAVVAGMAGTSSFGAEAAIAWCVRFAIMFARDRLPELIDESRELWRGWPYGAACDAYALTLAAGGRLEEAREVFTHISPIRRDYLFDLQISLRALAAMAVGEDAVAEDAYRLLLPFADGFVGTFTTAVAVCPAAWVLGEVATHLGLPEAAAHYARSAEVARKAGSDFWVRRSMARLA